MNIMGYLLTLIVTFAWYNIRMLSINDETFYKIKVIKK